MRPLSSLTIPARHAFALATLALAAVQAHAQVAVCRSDARAAVRVLFERFQSADCADCWTALDTPRAPRGAHTLDWVLPGAQGDDAPLSAVARREGAERLRALGLAMTASRQTHTQRVAAGQRRLQLAHGLVLGGYVGASLRFDGPSGGQQPLTGWLALVEWLPAGTEGSPEPRRLVRNLLTEPIHVGGRGAPQIWRPMNVPAGAQPERLGLVGWVTDARGRLLAAGQARCAAKS